MKTTHLPAILCASLALAAEAQVATPLNSQAAIFSDAPVLVDIGLHHRVWQTTRVDEGGQTNVSSFTELATGLNFLNPETGLFETSDPSFEITEDGFAISRRGQHSVILSPNLNTAEGVVDFLTPEGLRMRSGIIGLNLFDPVSGRSLQIASVTNAIGQQTAPNEITYFDAFDTLGGSVRIKNERGQFHQDVLLEERITPEHLAALGFDAKTVRLEVWTAFFESPTPTIRNVVLKSETNAVLRAAMAEPDEVDQILNFGGVMQMPTGKAFVDGVSGGKDVRVFKQWMQTPDGEKYLIEAASYSELKPLFDSLPLAKVIDPNGPLLAGHVPPRRIKAVKTEAFQIAQADVGKRAAGSPRVVWDYTTINTGQTNYVFAGDKTFFVSGTVNLSGTQTVFEAGCVLKFAPTNSPNLTLNGPSVWQGTSYRPCIFTGRDDNSVGDTITGSNGNPSTNYYGNPMLKLNYDDSPLKYLRLSYAEKAIQINYYSENHVLNHAQLVNCKYGLYNLADDNAAFKLRNVLFYKVLNICGGNYTYFYGEHVTVDQAANFYDVLYLTNSVIVSVTNTIYWSGTSNVFLTNGTGVFQTVGAAGHYLADNSPYRNAGTTNINASLLADLKKKTTYPPVEITTNFTGNTTLSPQAQRDTDLPDLGFHADPLDFVVSGRTLTNSILTLTNGVALGTYGPSSSYGIYIRKGGNLVSEGSPTHLNQIVRYNTVQEQATTNWSATSVAHSVKVSADTGTVPKGSFRFTGWSLLGGKGYHFYASYPSVTTPFGFKDCQFGPGWFEATQCPVALTNCLLERTSVNWDDDGGNFSYYAYNNLSRGGSLTLARNGSSAWVIKDNLFDQTAINNQSGSITHSNNAYINGYSRLTPTNANDIVLTNSPVYLTNWLGKFYYPTNDGMLSLLLDTGSRTATNAGLFHFTVTTNQAIEAISTVDIGFHFVAVTNGALIDSDTDGLADYFEDKNGNGVYDSGDIADWNSSDTDSDGVSDYLEYIQGRNPLIAGSVADTNGVVNLRVYTPLK